MPSAWCIFPEHFQVWHSSRSSNAQTLYLYLSQVLSLVQIPGVGSRPAALASPENLLAKQIPRLPPRPVEPHTLRVGPSTLCINQSVRGSEAYWYLGTTGPCCMYKLRAAGECGKKHLSLGGGTNHRRDEDLIERWHVNGDLNVGKSLDEPEGDTRHPSPS